MAERGEDEFAAATAEYIHGMAKELEVLASQAQLGFLAYLLSMVQQEAENVSRGDDTGATHGRPKLVG